METPNPTEEAFDNADNANSQVQNDGTVSTEAAPVDYEKKFSASSAEALRLLNENKEKDAEIERLRTSQASIQSDNLYPGFEQLDEDAQKNLIAYTDSVKKGVKEDLYKDPAIAFSRNMYNESKFDKAFASVAEKYPDLVASKDEFKSKYFQPNNTPDNIESLLGDLAKVHLFDKAQSIGAEAERTRANRIDTERARGGDKQVAHTSRTLEEWQQMAQENPAKFAQHSKEYQEDFGSGKLRE